MERLGLEFRQDELGREDLDALDGFFEHRRWLG